jgi:hypothetical protein
LQAVMEITKRDGDNFISALPATSARGRGLALVILKNPSTP